MSPAAPSFDVREALLAAARAELAEHGRAALSLRAIARRAGVSHAAPKYHFGDRAGLLTALATEGFRALSDALEAVSRPDPRDQLATLGEVYIDFGLANPALFQLMFQPGELRTDDPALVQAQTEAIGALRAAVGEPPAAIDGSATPHTLISWALAHGLAVLARDGALTAAAADQRDAADLARSLVRRYAETADSPTGRTAGRGSPPPGT